MLADKNSEADLLSMEGIRQTSLSAKNAETREAQKQSEAVWTGMTNSNKKYTVSSSVYPTPNPSDRATHTVIGKQPPCDHIFAPKSIHADAIPQKATASQKSQQKYLHVDPTTVL